ncbi:hydratase [Anoxynatronum sibiricum]|uniref:Hydratase n=1 Tax=Anoxynatronum sibiricum TaxID=210623 RepID=A0ABU9VSY2_9CLOT
MLKIWENGVYVVDETSIIADEPASQQLLEKLTGGQPERERARQETITYAMLAAHNVSEDMENLKLRFDAVASHDITYVGIIQTLKASGLERFQLPYVLTNCHNSLCAVGGTINEDDHLYGLSAARKYGGIYVPAHLAVIHQYMREMMVGCGRMILGSDSHTRYGSLGAMGVGEGGPELVRQLLGETYNLNYPEVVAVYLTGTPRPGVGPQDVALALIGKVFHTGLANNRVLEFIGDGIDSLDIEFRNGVDVMTTETTCLSSIWRTDEKVREYYGIHGRPEDYRCLQPGPVAYYDALIHLDLSAVEPMIAMPFHPANTYTIREVQKNLDEVLHEVEMKARQGKDQPDTTFSLKSKVRDGRLYVDQGVIAGCAGGTYGNLCAAAEILSGKSIGAGNFSLSVYPASQPVNLALMENGSLAALMEAGATLRTAICGPCFGAGDVPANNGFSIRHTTRNFPNREGSKPGSGQMASVALMDARSIAATAANGGALTAATEMETVGELPPYTFHQEIYTKRVYAGFDKPQANESLVMGPNITEWPEISPLTRHLLLQVASVILDPVTTTDELIPSGEASSYRSNPLLLAEYTLSRRDPGYVARARQTLLLETERQQGKNPLLKNEALAALGREIKVLIPEVQLEEVGIGSLVAARKPGDGSAREQAASCQRILGGWANIANEYATRRYRSNVINWGMLPFLYPEELDFQVGQYLLIPEIDQALTEKRDTVKAYVLGQAGEQPVSSLQLKLPPLNEEERQIIRAGCLMNYYRDRLQK